MIFYLFKSCVYSLLVGIGCCEGAPIIMWSILGFPTISVLPAWNYEPTPDYPMISFVLIFVLQAGHEVILMCESDPGAQQVRSSWKEHNWSYQQNLFISCVSRTVWIQECTPRTSHVFVAENCLCNEQRRSLSLVTFVLWLWPGMAPLASEPKQTHAVALYGVDRLFREWTGFSSSCLAEFIRWHQA